MQNLNQAQKEAVTHAEGPILILAGAGTGKTKVLIERIVYIINSYLADPKQILAVTFTNKAALEMKNRITTAIGDHAHNIWSGTFHGIANKILRRHPEIVGLQSDFTIIDSDDQLHLIKQITSELNIDNKQFPAKSYLYKISGFKDKALKPEDLKNSDTDLAYLPNLLKVYSNYQQRLITLNGADFGDLLLHNLTIFKTNEQLLSYYQDKFRYILVDEYQDTNGAQYQWLLKLADKYKNICAVGDDDQSIYSWRGAQIANILKFEEDFANTKIVKLECNYRSTGYILEAASHLIKNNHKRHNKTLWTTNPKGSKIKLLSYIDDKDEAVNIATIIELIHKQQQIKLSNIAILVRAGYQTRAFEEVFIQKSLPYRIIGGLRFYERKEIKDAIAYLRITANPSDDLALERIINLPRRGVGKVTLSNLFEKGKNEQSSLYTAIKRSIESATLKGKTKTALTELTDNIDRWQQLIVNQNVTEIAKEILEQSGYLAMWQNEKTPDAKGRIENIKEFINSLEEFTDLKTFLEHVSLVSSNDNKTEQQNDMINIMTIHSAKGLEFNTIFIPGLEEGIFPSGKAIEGKDGLEEERRLLYVAMTRAKKNLYLTFAHNRVIYGSFQASIVSRFLKELPQETIEADFKTELGTESHKSYNYYQKTPYKSSFFVNSCNSAKIKPEAKQLANKTKPITNDFLNKRIFHQKFGYGKVIEIQGRKLTIHFEKTGTKTIMKNFIQIIPNPIYK